MTRPTKEAQLKLSTIKNCKADIQKMLSSLTENQYKFYENIIVPDFQYNRDLINAYHRAGYEETEQSKYRARALYKHKVIKKLLEFHRQNQTEKLERRSVNIFDTIDSGLIECADIARKNADGPLLRAALMDRAKLHGLLVDRHQVIDPTSQSDLDNSVKLEAAKLAERMLLNAPESHENADLNDPDNDIIDSEFEPFNDDTDSLSDDTPDHSEGFLDD